MDRREATVKGGPALEEIPEIMGGWHARRHDM